MIRCWLRPYQVRVSPSVVAGGSSYHLTWLAGVGAPAGFRAVAVGSAERASVGS